MLSRANVFDDDISWKFHGNFMEISWKFHGIVVRCT